MPPHWNEGVEEDHGSRWAGQVRGLSLLCSSESTLSRLWQNSLTFHFAHPPPQGITVDSRVALGAPPRTYGNSPPNYDDEESEL